MSYALIAFDKQAALGASRDFMAWLDEQRRTDTDLSPFDPATTLPALQAWFKAMISEFPPLHGPLTPATVDFETITDYTNRRSYIYASFPTGAGYTTHELAVAQARQHSVGLYSPQESRVLLG